MSRSELSQGHSRECVGRRLLSRGKLLEIVAKDFEILTSLITKVASISSLLRNWLRVGYNLV